MRFIKTKIWIVTAVLISSSTFIVQNTHAAEITVKASKTVYVGKLQNGGLIHGNRDYSYDHIPKTVQDMQYTLHDHKAPSQLNVKVNKGGDLYLCLIECHWSRATSR